MTRAIPATLFGLIMAIPFIDALPPLGVGVLAGIGIAAIAIARRVS